jgi:hypothetical protein
MRCRGFSTVRISACLLRAREAAWARGLSSLVSGMGAKEKIKEILMAVTTLPYNGVVYRIVNYEIFVISTIGGTKLFFS